jgi:hypothetical protein
MNPLVRRTVVASAALWSICACAQDHVPPDSLKPKFVPIDSLQAVPSPAAAGSRVSRADSSAESAPTKSPGLAMLFSAVMPGAGQLYNESYWKVPVVLGLGGYFIYQFVHNNRIYNQYQDQYSESLVSNPSGDPNLLRLRDFYHDERDRFGWYFLILYALNILDAYVDASLYEFDVSGNLSLRVMPDGPLPASPVGQLSIMLRW